MTFLERQNSQLRELLAAERQAAAEQAASALDAPPSGTLIEDAEWAEHSEEEEEDELLPARARRRGERRAAASLLPQFDLDEAQMFPFPLLYFSLTCDYNFVFPIFY